ncbi:hypothetical protein SALB_08214 [Streptomyces noursei]|uniref:Uncharacterized protein n=1 Tax=Streptomyces noursei TaxID=1971 RepID=A0A401RCR8_STRNR|nr:hypothetical protein SALB_08214 [Streptomyces noursei]
MPGYPACHGWVHAGELPQAAPAGPRIGSARREQADGLGNPVEPPPVQAGAALNQADHRLGGQIEGPIRLRSPGAFRVTARDRLRGGL